MVFDFNCWNRKWANCEPGDSNLEYYWEKLQQAKNDFSDDWMTFLECYNDPTHVMRINDEFLDEKIEEIIEKKLFIPTGGFNSYLFDRYPQYKKDIQKVILDQWKNGMQGSVDATGLKQLYANVRTKEDKTQLLLFEVVEFALTYPEYEDIFIEEFIE